MEQLRLFIELTRLKKPIGFMLLFWPCSWGLILAYNKNISVEQFIYYLFYFFCGSVLMRSAGCVVNDIADKNFDDKVKRTKYRPIASGKISVIQGFVYASVLCLIALIILLQFNTFTIVLALLSMPFAFTYPLMKRFTYWPQLFLGITFNYGLILAWTSIYSQLSIYPLIFYFGAIFWTLGYDTIYGFQDIKDDEIIGVKSTSIKFKKNPKIFLFICYSITFISILLLGILMKFDFIYFIGLILIGYLLFKQIKKFDKDNPNNCLDLFKSNNLLGLIMFLNILIAKLY
ncbi:MAG: 4-hydroxybenzoate octaprenyltransferase [Candidatus Pelagibacter sp.]|tara:strand:+ start:2170 stop:3033 length:864 start_codon:yes stop_codon:yes gene_type:complete